LALVVQQAPAELWLAAMEVILYFLALHQQVVVAALHMKQTQVEQVVLVAVEIMDLNPGHLFLQGGLGQQIKALQEATA
jgi:hypothetical protein